ncbi:MAG TPA: hypothetical protein VHC97_06150 [Thermoanaerobaculia bacterium]|jgi:hypothetical protein|nr:hypothetical protein [Thermoanaerobaculia bacterium]
MRRTTVTTALLLALSLAPALQAQYRDSRDQDRYRNDSRYGRGDRIAAVADEIADTAYSIRREYERNNRRPDRDEARVLSDLRDLDARASRFRDQLGYRQSRNNGEFAALEDAFFDLAESLRYISARPYVERGMDRISGLMREASRYYGRDGRDNRDNRDGRGSRYDRYGRGGNWHDRYGRGGYDGRDGRYDRDRDDDAYRTRPPHK